MNTAIGRRLLLRVRHDLREDERVDRQQQQRVDERPEEPEDRPPVARLQLARHEALDQPAIATELRRGYATSIWISSTVMLSGPPASFAASTSASHVACSGCPSRQMRLEPVVRHHGREPVGAEQQAVARHDVERRDLHLWIVAARQIARVTTLRHGWCCASASRQHAGPHLLADPRMVLPSARRSRSPAPAIDAAVADVRDHRACPCRGARRPRSSPCRAGADRRPSRRQPAVGQPEGGLQPIAVRRRATGRTARARSGSGRRRASRR